MNKIEQQINISKKVLDAIENHNVKPKPRWYFVLQEGGVWVLGMVTTFFGALAVSITLFVIAVAPVKFQPATHDSLLKFWLEFVPLVWLILFVSFIFATDYLLRKTKRGYKYSFVVLTLSSVTLSVLLGYLGFIVGLGELVEKGVGSRVPFHTSSEVMIHKVLSQPSKGLLVGKISNNQTTLETREGDMIDLDTSQIPETQRSLIMDGTLVSIIGTTTPENTFFVCMIIPLNSIRKSPEEIYFERKILDERTNTCKGVRPYDRLKAKILNYEN